MKSSTLISICLVLAFAQLNGYGQSGGKRKKKCDTCNDAKAQAGQFKKGEFYLYWGYNRAAYSKSTISFMGDGSNFKLHKVAAKDRPTPFNAQDYFVSITVPQFVTSGGYFFKDNWSIGFGTDHMKYVMRENQTLKIDGTIANTPESSPYAGNYSGDDIFVSPYFLRYEHTNGLNYINATIDHYKVLWDAQKGPSKLVLVPGAGLGILYPRSDVDLFNQEGSNIFHVAGWGVDAHAGLRFNILKNMFVLWNNKAGFIHLPDVLCDVNKYKAKQAFFFFQSAFSLGANFRF